MTERIDETRHASDPTASPPPTSRGDGPLGRRKGRSWHGLALIAILVIAGVLRLGHSDQVGIRFDDEGAYVMEARLWNHWARILINGEVIRAAFEGDKAAVKQRRDDIGIHFNWRYGKPCPGYTVLGAMMMFVTGDRPESLIVVNGVLGTLTVLLVYGLGVILFGRTTGLCAALALAVSGYHIVYCRSAWVSASIVFFTLLGFWLFALGRQRGWSRRVTYSLQWPGFGLCVYLSL